MKAVLVILLMGASLTVSAMGHPHNLFSAHKKAKNLNTKQATVQRAPQTSLVKRSLTATVKAAAPGVASFAWTVLKKFQ